MIFKKYQKRICEEVEKCKSSDELIVTLESAKFGLLSDLLKLGEKSLNTQK